MMLYYLHLLGWESIAVNVWRDHLGNLWTLDSDSLSPETLICAAIDRLNSLDAVEAALHYGGNGMQDGIDYNNSFAWHKSKSIAGAPCNVVKVILKVKENLQKMQGVTAQHGFRPEANCMTARDCGKEGYGKTARR